MAVELRVSGKVSSQGSRSLEKKTPQLPEIQALAMHCDYIRIVLWRCHHRP